MKRNKGCPDEACEAHVRKIKYKSSDQFCSKCGSELVYVCKGCYTILPNASNKFCTRCISKTEDRKDKFMGAANKIGGGMATFGVAAAALGKIVLDKYKK